MKPTLKKFKRWIIENYEEKNDTETVDLIWVKRTLKPGKKIDWSFVDTVDYDINSIPKKRELIFEFKAKPREVVRKCQNLLN